MGYGNTLCHIAYCVVHSLYSVQATTKTIAYVQCRQRRRHWVATACQRHVQFAAVIVGRIEQEPLNMGTLLGTIIMLCADVGVLPSDLHVSK